MCATNLRARSILDVELLSNYYNLQNFCMNCQNQQATPADHFDDTLGQDSYFGPPMRQLPAVEHPKWEFTAQNNQPQDAHFGGKTNCDETEKILPSITNFKKMVEKEWQDRQINLVYNTYIENYEMFLSDEQQFKGQLMDAIFEPSLQEQEEFYALQRADGRICLIIAQNTFGISVTQK